MALPSYDPELKKIKEILGRVNSLASIERRSGVCASTMRKWLNNTTRRPQNLTITFAMRAAGFERDWKPINKK